MKLILAAVASLLAGAANADVLDNFNRPDAGTLGSAWTQLSGVASVASNQATGSDFAFSILNGVSSDSVSFDIHNNGESLQYIAAVLGYSAGSNYYIKIQNNNGAGFNTFGFYRGNGITQYFNYLSSDFYNAHIVVSGVGSVYSLDITPDVGASQHYSYDYGVVYDGTGVGLGFYGPASADNFAIPGSDVPEPASWALMIVGFGLVGAAARRRSMATA